VNREADPRFHDRMRCWNRSAVDSLSPQERSEIMSRVRSKNSRPELFVRKLVYSLGYRYRLHQRQLAGCPDLVFARSRKVIFVHGCFWHRHARCALARMPKSRIDFWQPKLEANKERDKRNRRTLSRGGWRVLTIWECQLKDFERLRNAVRRFLDA
jgi:DNA mismatch endonuclease, patch repair protein